MFQENEKILLITFGIMLLVPFSMVLLFMVFNKRKNILLNEQFEAKRRFERELIESQIEIREETLRNISWELHDNIGQLVTLAKIYLQNSNNDPEKIQETVEIIGKALNEVRALSRSINPESFKNMGLIDSVTNEMNRFERMKFMKTDFKIVGNVIEISDKDQIIIFRILQEFFSNTMKHSRATLMELLFEYDENKLEIRCKDNGVGFNQDDEFIGIGLKNMKNRAKMIGAKLSIHSKENEGTELKIKKIYTHET